MKRLTTMQFRIRRRAGSRRRRPAGGRSRRGVTGVLAMMFLIMFGSLAVAMAIVSQGNLQTAETHLRVSRALGAVDTGMELAANRLQEAASRCVVAKGEITPAYAQELWNGTYSDDPPVTFLPPPNGRVEDTPASSLMEAVQSVHDADDIDNIADDIAIPTPPTGWVVGAPIGIEKDSNGRIVTATQMTYLPPDAEGRVLVVVTGYDWDWNRNTYVTRTAQQYFSLTKSVDHAVLTPSRLMIGRNVQVEGPLGVRYNSQALDELDGPPLVVRSDFYGLDPILDDKLDDFFEAVLEYDMDGDNRLRTQHSVESQPLDSLNLNDYEDDPDTDPDAAFQDITSDAYIDEYDVFIQHYDSDGDGEVVLSAALTLGTPAQGRSPEFIADDALAYLIDSGLPDRNGNGRRNGDFVAGAWDYTTFPDNNLDGVTDSLDVDYDDVILGYRDGVLSYRDRYAKIRGSANLAAARADWEAAQDDFGEVIGDYQQYVEGTMVTSTGSPVNFEASDAELPPISDSSFDAATQALIDIANDGAPFQSQVDLAKGGGWTPPTIIESTPYGSPTPADWYERPVYEDIVFKDVVIPMGTNALFINCTFVGATRVEAYADNTHPSWSYYGTQARDQVTGNLSFAYPPPPDESPAQLDKSYSTPANPGYDSLPDPLMVSVDLNGDGVTPDQCTNTKLISNNIRFHDCLFVGSIVADKPVIFRNIRNKLQFTGATRFLEEHPDYPGDPDYNPDDSDMDEIAKSSMMLPNYSVDIGTNNSPQTQDVRLRGAIIAGVMDVRGNAEIQGVLMLTYSPVYGEAPMDSYGTPVGNPADYNATLGYFGPEDGDYEGIDLQDVEDLDGDGVPDIGWDSARDADGNLITTDDWDGTHDDLWYDGVPDTDADIDPGQYVKRAIPFNGFGQIKLEWDPTIILPDGLETPLQINPIRATYEEGKFDLSAY